MKIIFLNTWNGEMKDEISKFIREQSQNTDVFCFQEVYPEMRALCRNLLGDFEEFYAYKKIDNDDFPQATFVKKPLVAKSQTILEQINEGGIGLDVKISTGGKNIHICNFHGQWRPDNKLDSPARFKQAEGLLDFYSTVEDLKIIGGDFNMLPATAAMLMFGENGYRDLIKEFNIEKTRPESTLAQYPENRQPYADYIFIDPGIKLKSFEVIECEISDHLPLVLEVDV